MAWSRAAFVVVATRYGYIADFGKACPGLTSGATTTAITISP
jgi:hypothetical protein